MNNPKNVFISHHHKDDSSVDNLISLLKKNGYDVRNSSIRVKPKNQGRLDNKMISDNTIKRLLRMKMRWAGSVIVIIGKETYKREWVNWEIEQAEKQGKYIIGVFENGLKDKVEIPEALEKYAAAIHGWDSSNIIDSLNGKDNFQNPDGTPSEKKEGPHIIC